MSKNRCIHYVWVGTPKNYFSANSLHRMSTKQTHACCIEIKLDRLWCRRPWTHASPTGTSKNCTNTLAQISISKRPNSEFNTCLVPKWTCFLPIAKSYCYGSLRQNLGQVQLENWNTQKCISACIAHVWFLTPGEGSCEFLIGWFVWK